jgi:hypothetical protein
VDFHIWDFLHEKHHMSLIRWHHKIALIPMSPTKPVTSDFDENSSRNVENIGETRYQMSMVDSKVFRHRKFWKYVHWPYDWRNANWDRRTFVLPPSILAEHEDK